MTRTGTAATNWARAQHSWHPIGMCLVFTRSAFSVPARYGSARLAWTNARRKHRTGSGGIPPGVPVFWLGGSHGYGHIALSLGNGLCRSTDWPHAYQVNTARIDDITRRWGQHFQGWTEDLNGITVYKGNAAASGFVIDVSNVQHAARNDGKIVNGTKLKKAVAAEVGKGSMNLATTTLGANFREQYKHVQRAYLRAVGSKPGPGDVDGIPGRGSLEWLGRRHGFSIRS